MSKTNELKKLNKTIFAKKKKKKKMSGVLLNYFCSLQTLIYI